MRVSDAVEMIRPAVDRPGGVWADFGAGAGLFTLALAELLDSSGRILAIDRDRKALATLAKSLQPARDHRPSVAPIEGDVQELESIDALAGVQLDGAIFANALHFIPDPAEVLAQLRPRLRAGGRVLVIEYADRPPSPWVPYPISVSALQELAQHARLRFAGVLTQRPSRYGGTMYCALVENGSA